jgi:type IV pilus assembly protein PilF
MMATIIAPRHTNGVSLTLTMLITITLVNGCTPAHRPATEAPSATAVLPESRKAINSDQRQRARIRTELSSQYLALGNPGTAVVEAKNAIESDPDYAPAHGILALSYMSLQENAQAESAFRRAFQLAPSDPEIQNNYGWFLCKTGRASQSIAYFNKALANPLYPTPETAHANLGYCHNQLKEYTQAEASYRRALDLSPDTVHANAGLAQSLFGIGRFLEVVAQTRKLHRLITPTPATLWLGARAAWRVGDGAALQEFATELRSRYPDSEECKQLNQGAYQ